MLEKLVIYIGCECLCLEHVAQMIYFPPREGEKIDQDENVIYITVKTETYLNRLVPPFSFDPLDWFFDFGEYFRYHIFKRIPIALRYIFNSKSLKDYELFDCFDFQIKDILTMKEFLSHLSQEEIKATKQSCICLNNERWQIVFTIRRDIEEMPYSVGWDVQFIPRKIFGRIKYALQYIFGRVSDQQCFEINEKTAKELKGLITTAQQINGDMYK